jgi:hypothetical protein
MNDFPLQLGYYKHVGIADMEPFDVREIDTEKVARIMNLSPDTIHRIFPSRLFPVGGIYVMINCSDENEFILLLETKWFLYNGQGGIHFDRVNKLAEATTKSLGRSKFDWHTNFYFDHKQKEFDAVYVDL